MKNQILLLNFFLMSVINLSAKDNKMPTKYFDLIHTDLILRPIWETHQMKGQATLLLVPYFQPQSKITIDAKALKVELIQAITKSGKIKLEFNQTKDKLIIFLDKPYFKKDSLKLNIVYTANPDSVKSDEGEAIKEEKGLYFINTDKKQKNVPMHLWTQGEVQANSCWYPTIDQPYEKQTQTIKVTYEDKFVSLSNGKLVSSIKNPDGTKTDYWVQKLPHSVYLSVLVIGEYKIVKDIWRGKEVSYYMEPQYEKMARPIFGRTPEMIEFFSTKLGVDYPWDKYSQVIVHEFVAGAMENTSASTFHTLFQKDARELIDDNDDETVAHELFHHWFGDLATCEDWAHLTLNESFANYSEYLWTEHKYGKDAAEAHWSRDLAPYFSSSTRKKEPLVRYDYEKPDDMFDIISYNKGGKILHMLRVYLGDDIFFKGLKHYLTKFSFKTAEYSDLRKSMEEVSGEDLNWYFNQWYLKGGHPVVQTSYKKSADQAQIFLAQKHNFDSTFIYNLPLSFDVYTGDIIKRVSFTLTKKSDTFTIQEKDIKAIVVDATNSLVGVKNETKELEDWIYILKNSSSFTDKNNAVKKLKKHLSNDKVKDALFETLSSEKPRLVLATIRMIEKSWLEKEPKWNEKLLQIAKNNSFGPTRSVAITKLADNKELGIYKEFALERLTDSSYSVEEEALKLLDKIDSPAALTYALTKTESNHFGVSNTVFEIITKTKNPVYLNLFESAYASKQGFKKIAVFMNYGKYLSYMPDPIIDAKISMLDTLIIQEDEMDVYSAKSALKALKSELATREDKASKDRVLKIDAIISKAKKTSEDEE